MWHVEDVRDVILIFFECNSIYVKDVADRSNTLKACNAMYVEDVKDGKRTYTHIFVQGMWHVKDVRDVILIFYECNAIYVEDIKDRSNTPKGSNATYVKDAKDWKRTYICHGFVSAGDALGREHLATPMSSFLAGCSGCKWPNTYLLLGQAPLGGAYGWQSLLRSTPTLEGGQRTGARITKWMGG